MANGLNKYLMQDEELDPAQTPLLDYMQVNAMNEAPPTSNSSALAKMYNELSRQAISDEQIGLSQLQNYIDEYGNAPRPTDYRALAAWADTLRPGTKIVETAQALAPESEDTRQAKFLNLQQQLQQRKGAFTQKQLEGLKSMIGQQSAADRLAQQQAFRQQQFAQTQALAEKKYEAEAKRSEEYLRHNQAMEKLTAEGIAARERAASATQTRADERQQEGLKEKREKKVEDQLIKFNDKSIEVTFFFF